MDINGDKNRIFFALNAQSFKLGNEIHLVEYLPLLGSAVCQGVYKTSNYLEQIEFDDKNTRKLICLENEKNRASQNSSLVTLDRSAWAIKNVTCKQDTYSIAKQALASKRDLPRNPKIDLDFFAEG